MIGDTLNYNRNILIIAAGRCGGRYLMESLAKTYNLKKCHEPKFSVLTRPNINFNDTCVKLYHSNKWFSTYTDENWLELGSKFDHIIVLDRKITTEYLESLYVMSNITKNMYVTYDYGKLLKKHITSFDSKKKYENHHESEMNRYTNQSKILNKRLNEIASLFKQKVVLYDELYYNPNKIDYLNGLEFNPNLNHKLRTDGINKNKTLI